MKQESLAKLPNVQSVKPRQVDLTQLKAVVRQQVPTTWPLHKVLADEDSQMDVPVFLVRLPVYLKLLDMGGK